MQKIIDERGKLFGKINLLDLLVIIILSGLLVFGCWDVAYRYQYQRDTGSLRVITEMLKGKMNTLKNEALYWQDKYEVSQSEVRACREVLREEAERLQERLERIFKVYPRLRRKFR